MREYYAFAPDGCVFYHERSTPQAVGMTRQVRQRFGASKTNIGVPCEKMQSTSSIIIGRFSSSSNPLAASGPTGKSSASASPNGPAGTSAPTAPPTAPFARAPRLSSRTTSRRSPKRPSSMMPRPSSRRSTSERRSLRSRRTPPPQLPRPHPAQHRPLPPRMLIRTLMAR